MGGFCDVNRVSRSFEAPFKNDPTERLKKADVRLSAAPQRTEGVTLQL